MKLKIFIVLLGLQVLYLGATTFVQERRLQLGARVLLETAPVDPRDLLRGDYVVLRYPINEIDAGLFAPALSEGDLLEGTQVLVALEQREEYWEAAAASLWPLEPEPGQVVIRGRARELDGWSPGLPVPVEYGLEQYFVREGTGNPRGKLTVEASVSSDGTPMIRQVYLDGVPYAEAMRASAAQ